MQSRNALFRNHQLRSVKFQVISDLHLELGHYYPPFEIPPEAPYLILAGDIGRLWEHDNMLQFFKAQCAKFNHVYLILGNHEFYGLTRQAGLEAAAKLQAEPCLQSRLTILNRQRVDISEEVTLLGCTLHSHILPEARAIVEAKISDFRKISDWTVDEHNKEHLLDLDWLRSEVASIEENEPKRRVIIATHHAPSYANTTNPAFEQSPWGSAFCTSILESKAEEHWLHARCLRYWIFGHTHWTCQFLSKNIVVVSNQRGYDRDPTHPPAEGSPKPKLLRLFSGPKTAGFDVHKTISI